MYTDKDFAMNKDNVIKVKEVDESDEERGGKEESDEDEIRDYESKIKGKKSRGEKRDKILIGKGLFNSK